MRGLGGCLGACFVAIGCSSFTTVPNTTTANDAGVETLDGATAPSRGSSCAESSAPLCADFETESSYRGDWLASHAPNSSRLGAVDRDTTFANDGTTSLKTTLFGSIVDSGAVVELHSEGLDDVYMEADVYIPSPGVRLTDQLTILAIQRAGDDGVTDAEANIRPNGDAGVFLVLYAKGTKEASLDKDSDNGTIVIPFNRWTRIRLESALWGDETAMGHGSVALVRDGGPTAGIRATLLRARASSPVTRWLVGMYRYKTKLVGDFTVYYDNVIGGPL